MGSFWSGGTIDLSGGLYPSGSLPRSGGLGPSVFGIESEGGGGGGGPQIPASAPGGTTQGIPAQQSDVVVQTPPCGTQGAAPHLRCPCASGTQGRLLQQSADEAQSPPAGTHAPRP